MADDRGILDGIRVLEVAENRGAYAGLLLAGLGAEVLKVEPPGGSRSRAVGPFLDGEAGPERSLHFWQHNRGKRSVVLDGLAGLQDLARDADVILLGTDDDSLVLEPDDDQIVARLTAFGDDGPWAAFKGSDLVHLALGGPVMNCGYDPMPSGRYDLPPVAPQEGHAEMIAGEQLVIGVLAALVHRQRTGEGQTISLAVHEAVSKCTELDIMNWVMLRRPLLRQTCRHAAEKVSSVPTIAETKDGRWFVTTPLGAKDEQKLVTFLEEQGIATGLADTAGDDGGVRAIPGSTGESDRSARVTELTQRLVRKHTYDGFPWHEAQRAGLACAPLRRPHENALDDHWHERRTFATVEHPEVGRSFTYAVRKWLSTAPSWRVGGRAPLVGEHGGWSSTTRLPATPRRENPSSSAHGKPFALDGVRVLDFTWFLASAGGTRFLASLGAECIKVEWKGNPDTRMAAMAPVGGRATRDAATGPLDGVKDPDMGGQFNNKNPGKRGLSLNVRDPRGLDIARQLVKLSDVVAEGFSPGVMDKWGLGWDALRELKPDVIYAQQSGMGSAGRYGRYRAVGPVAAALSGISEMSGLPSPAMPAGWGYSYLDWIGAYSFAAAILGALFHRDRTGEGQWIDASQTESGIYLAGGAILDWSANGTVWERTGNGPRGVDAAPHGIYPTAGDDRWIAITCFDEAEWKALASVIGQPWVADERFNSLNGRSANRAALDEAVAAWTSTQDGYALMQELQAAGVAAGVCQTAADRIERDPQLAHLEWLTEVTGTKIGTWPVIEMPVKMSATPPYAGGPIDRGAPGYGEDNEWVLGELLGMSSKAIAELAEDGVI